MLSDVTDSEFVAIVRSLECTVDGQPTWALPKCFRTGSLGWFHNGKQRLSVRGEEVLCQVSICVTVIGSKARKITDEGPNRPQDAPGPLEAIWEAAEAGKAAAAAPEASGGREKASGGEVLPGALPPMRKKRRKQS